MSDKVPGFAGLRTLTHIQTTPCKQAILYSHMHTVTNSKVTWNVSDMISSALIIWLNEIELSLWLGALEQVSLAVSGIH